MPRLRALRAAAGEDVRVLEKPFTLDELDALLPTSWPSGGGASPEVARAFLQAETKMSHEGQMTAPPRNPLEARPALVGEPGLNLALSRIGFTPAAAAHKATSRSGAASGCST